MSIHNIYVLIHFQEQMMGYFVGIQMLSAKFITYLESLSDRSNISFEKVFVITSVCTHVRFIRISKHQRILFRLKSALKPHFNLIFTFSKWFCCNKTMFDEIKNFRLRSCQKFLQ